MTHSKIFTRADGSEVKITAYITFNYQRILHWYSSGFVSVKDTANSDFRHIDTEDRLNYATPEEILEVELELWHSLEPKILSADVNMQGE